MQTEETRTEGPGAATALRRMLREQLCCLGRVVARHQIPDDAVWEIAKGFDVIYQQMRRRIETPVPRARGQRAPHRMEPHPGLLYLLSRLDNEPRHAPPRAAQR